MLPQYYAAVTLSSRKTMMKVIQAGLDRLDRLNTRIIANVQNSMQT